MARYSSIALGKARGSAGNVRFSVWKGIPVAAQKPETVANPRSPKQLAARSRISVIVAAFRQMPDFVNAVFAALAVKQSAYNAYVSAQNKTELLTFVGGNATEIAQGGIAIYNKDTPIGNVSITETVDDTRFDFSNLTPSRQYSAIAVVQNSEGEFSQHIFDSFTTDVVGSGLLSVDNGIWGLTNRTYSAIIIQDLVTAAKYAYKGQIL